MASRILLPLAFPSSANRPYESQDVDEMAQAVTRKAPDYRISRLSGIETGRVDIKFEITSEGTVENIRVVSSSNPALEKPAIAAMREWRFKPARRDGVPVRVTAMQPFVFDVRQ